MLLLAVIVSAVAYFLFKVYQRSTNPHYPPSPPGLPIIGNLHQYDVSATHLYLFQLSKKYGPLMSMKLGSVQALIVSSAKMAEQVLKTHDLSFCSRPYTRAFYKISYNGLDVGFAPYNESWRERRKICVLHLLSGKQVQCFRPIREDEIYRMIKNVKTSSKCNGVINFNETMTGLTSSLILRTAFGKKYEAGESTYGKFDQLMTEIQALFAGFYVSDYFPWFSWMDRLSGMEARLDRTFRDLDQFYSEMIDEHLNSDRSKMTNIHFLGMLIQLKEQNLCPFDLTWNHVKALLFDIFFAGTETSATVIVWTMTALVKNPDIMKKLQTEIRQTITGKSGFVNEDDLPNFHYLKAIVKESLRLYPPVPLILPRESMETCVIEGYTIPPKTTVQINAWAIARDPEYWERPDEFLPERFLDNPVDVMGQHFQFLPFGAGRRKCPAISMGLATVELALANLLYSFDWELANGMKKEDVDTEFLPGIGTKKKNPLYLVPRNYLCA